MLTCSPSAGNLEGSGTLSVAVFPVLGLKSRMNKPLWLWLSITQVPCVVKPVSVGVRTATVPFAGMSETTVEPEAVMSVGAASSWMEKPLVPYPAPFA